MTTQTIQVSTAAGLMSALATATGGETIQLAAGNYGGVYLSQYNFAQKVNIVGGTFSSIQVVSSNGLSFEGTTVNFVPDATSTSNSQGVRVYLSQNINFNNATLVGGLSVNGVDPSAPYGDSTGNVLGYPVGKGINFDNSSNCSITNSDISMFAKGVTITGGSNFLVDNNDIHDLRTTPISGSVTSNLTISNNHTWDSHPWNFGAQDHGDRIHIWTSGTPILGANASQLCWNFNISLGTDDRYFLFDRCTFIVDMDSLGSGNVYNNLFYLANSTTLQFQGCTFLMVGRNSSSNNQYVFTWNSTSATSSVITSGV